MTSEAEAVEAEAIGKATASASLDETKGLLNIGRLYEFPPTFLPIFWCTCLQHSLNPIHLIT